MPLNKSTSLGMCGSAVRSSPMRCAAFCGVPPFCQRFHRGLPSIWQTGGVGPCFGSNPVVLHLSIMYICIFIVLPVACFSVYLPSTPLVLFSSRTTAVCISCSVHPSIHPVVYVPAHIYRRALQSRMGVPTHRLETHCRQRPKKTEA